VNELSPFSLKKDTIIDHHYTLESKQAFSFFKNNDNIILTRADKGNITVALDKINYIREIKEMLKNNNIYITVKKDPTRSIIGSLRKLHTRWKNSEFISTTMHNLMTNSNRLLPRAYGLPKVHKPNCPFRIIISSVDSPLYAIASFLQKTIGTNIPTALILDPIMLKISPHVDSHIDNSFDLVKKLTNMHIDDEFSLISLDMVSLFTNIPIELVVKSVENRWNYISSNCNIPRDEFIELD